MAKPEQELDVVKGLLHPCAYVGLADRDSGAALEKCITVRNDHMQLPHTGGRQLRLHKEALGGIQQQRAMLSGDSVDSGVAI